MSVQSYGKLLPETRDTTALRELRAVTILQHHALCAHSNQRQKAQQERPDISLLSPVLQKQWDHAANAQLGNIVIRPHSHRKASWKCEQCPDGHLHQWTAPVANRTKGRGCPQCSGYKVCLHNCLRRIAPWAAAQWDYEANAALGTPDSIIANSHQVVGWHCQVCSHRWTASPNSRVQHQSGCPKCARRGPVTKHPTFAESHHPLLEQWDHKRNEVCGNHPHNTRLGSGKQIYWLCNRCPAGQEHSWSAQPASRTSYHQCGCPICAGHVACRCNSLQALFPDTAAEWDHRKNKGQPSDYTARSNRLVWWYTPQHGSWQQIINARTNSVIQQSATVKYKLQQ